MLHLKVEQRLARLHLGHDLCIGHVDGVKVGARLAHVLVSAAVAQVNIVYLKLRAQRLDALLVPVTQQRQLVLGGSR